ncbi:MAG: bifunctional glutamate N-acetyltransferase/amino-acid acetyltransferase ArgJ, partial [Phycisphaeraceae bacterium]
MPPKRHITAPAGFYAAGTTCGIKESGLPDLGLIVCDRAATAAGVFTRSRTPGAPVTVTRSHLRRGRARGIVINSGNANDCTGQAGLRDARAMARRVAERMGQQQHPAAGPPWRAGDVLVASTGIIGHLLPMERVTAGIDTLAARLHRDAAADAELARAILTTDLTTKAAHRRVTIGGRKVQLAGVAKGSGMIAPNMATMLAFVTTDAAVAVAPLRQALKRAAAVSFNRISVDQHTSPSDMLLALASGAAGHETIAGPGADLDTLQAALTDLCQDLAYQIVADGEGATRIFRVEVRTARSEREADRVGKTIVDSPLVKTAVHGSDPNWGRIVTAAGYSGAAINPGRMSLHIGGGCSGGGGG